MKTNRRDAGFSLAALIVFATIASIFIAAAVPVYQMQAKRELEEELIFRGGEYTRAIQKYRAKFGAYPTSIDQLVQTNGLHFLRKAYKDPITGKDFRLLTLNPDGSINGSKTFQQNMNNQPLFGNTSSGAQMGQNQSPFGSQTQNQQQQPGGSGQQQQPGGFGQPQQPGGFGQPQQPGGFGAFGGATNGSRGFGGFAPPPGQQGQQSGQPNQQQPQQGGFQGFGVSSGFGSTPVGSSGQIVGVASDSDKPSIKIYNNRQKYNEWDFVALLNQNGQPNSLQNPGAGQRGSSNPFQTSPQTQGGAFGGSPFGTGQQSTQNPFGTGTTTPTTPTTPPK